MKLKELGKIFVCRQDSKTTLKEYWRISAAKIILIFSKTPSFNYRQTKVKSSSKGDLVKVTTS